MTHTPFCNILQLLSKRPHLTLKRSLIISLSHTLRIHDRHSTSIDQKVVFFDIFVYNSQLMKTSQRFRKSGEIINRGVPGIGDLFYEDDSALFGDVTKRLALAPF